METNEDLVMLLNDVIDSTAKLAYKYNMSKTDISALDAKFNNLAVYLSDVFNYNDKLDEFLSDALPEGIYDFLTSWFYAMVQNQAIMSQIGCLPMDSAARMVTVMNPDELQ